jgi:hypothetical protein
MRAVLLVALVVPAAAAAQRGVGVELGLRLAWAPAVGSAAEHVPMSEAIAWQVPIQADVLWTAERFAAGVYGSWGPGGVSGGACADGASCSAQVVRAGAQVLWRFSRWSFGAAPWLGGGLGWEWASQRRERLGAASTTSWNGPELALQGGADWRLGERFGGGPFVLVGAGRYERVSVETPRDAGSADIADRSVHGWIQLGVRGSCDFF